MTWDELQRRFLDNIEASYAATVGRLEAAITATPAAFEAKVQGFLAMLAECKANLARILAHLPNPPRNAVEAQLVTRYVEMRALYDALLLGLSENAVPLPSVGLAPLVVLAIGGMGLTAAGVAWAVAAWEYAASLRDQSGLLARELEARVEAMRQGTQLPPSTVAAPKPPDDPKGGVWPWLLGLGALAAGVVFVVPKLGKG